MVQVRYCINRVTHEENGKREERDEVLGATVKLVLDRAVGREIKNGCLFLFHVHVVTIENVNMIVTRQNRKINDTLSPSIFMRHSSFYL